ncbi:NAD-dependent epimerase/dehydratase family protein [Opitutales bacterium]|nr:NAD-dependent epimerase/dehydratase family protein [Opitutales bacterium]
MKKKIIVFGGDGFCGWPTSLYLSNIGHDITIIDNLSRRKIDIELQVESLTPISSINKRIETWKEVSGETLNYINFDIAKDYHLLLQAIAMIKPDAIIHFAEQRAAPYSMKTSFHKRYTVDNNLNATNNLCAAIVESGLDIHLIHLGTMGVYGYGTAGMKIPEGYLEVEVKEENKRANMEILYPAHPGSIYHMTKTQDQLFFYFYNKNDKLRITDLHQGIVWGTQTPETSMHENLINRFDYDGDYGTVLNRFLMQAAVGYPLTVHGTGGQTRAFIHITDTAKCIQIALDNPPAKDSRVKIYNQMVETHKVRELAKLVSQMTDTEISYLENPRNEAPENDLHVTNDCFLKDGLNPTKLKEGLLDEVIDVSRKFKDRALLEKIPCISKWS